jgi:hypothetical protein
MLKDSNLCFSEQVDYAIEVFNRLIITYMPFALSMMAENSLKKLFKGKGLDEDIIALNMDLTENPTAEMGYMQAELASFPEFIACTGAYDFSQKLKNNGFSDEFMAVYRDYMQKYGSQVSEAQINKGYNLIPIVTNNFERTPFITGAETRASYIA